MIRGQEKNASIGTSSGKSQDWKECVFGFQDKIQTISGKSGKKFPGKSDVFGGEFSQNLRIGKFQIRKISEKN
jgi:hypothetical protein